MAEWLPVPVSGDVAGMAVGGGAGRVPAVAVVVAVVEVDGPPLPLLDSCWGICLQTDRRADGVYAGSDTMQCRNEPLLRCYQCPSAACSSRPSASLVAAPLSRSKLS
jgi:hypothetical protein